MSIRFKLTLLITLLFVSVVFPGAMFVILNARQAVSKELESNAELALQLLTVAAISGTTEHLQAWRSTLMNNINELPNIRHLNISIRAENDTPGMPVAELGESLVTAVPSWFTRMVAPPPTEFRRRLSSPHVPYTEIVVRPDPTDELHEAWTETRLLLGLLLLLVLLVNGLIFLAIGRALRPIHRVLDALNVIELGDYRARLPRFNSPELNEISRSFNQMAKVLELERQARRALSKRTFAIQEDERRHLAHELHDELGQSISAIKAVAVFIAQRKHLIGTPVQEAADSIVSICNNVFDVVRGMMNRLRPFILDEFGLETALERIVDDWNSHHRNCSCRLVVEGNSLNLSNEVQINIYRIVQECLTNIAKHAQASAAEIHMAVVESVNDRAAKYLTLDIKDNGRGFDKTQRRHGFGLLGIRERVEAMNGTLDVNTSLGTGVLVHIYLPVQALGNAR